MRGERMKDENDFEGLFIADEYFNEDVLHDSDESSCEDVFMPQFDHVTDC